MRSAIALLLAALVIPACAAPADDGGEGASAAAQTTAGPATEIATGRAFPREVVASGTRLLWTEGRLLPTESGQQFRFDGQVFLSEAGGAPTQVASFPDTVKDVLVSGDDVFFVRPSGIARASMTGLARGQAPTSVYDDARYPREAPRPAGGVQEGVTSAALDGGRLYLLRSSGEIASVTTDGRDFREHAKVDGEAMGLVVSGGVAAFTTGWMGMAMQRVVQRLDLRTPGAAPEQITRGMLAHEWRGPALVKDGESVLYPTRTGLVRFGLASGGPEPVLEGFRSVRHARFDGEVLLVLGTWGSEEGVFAVARGATTPRLVRPVSDGTGVYPLRDGVYVTTGATRIDVPSTGHIDAYLGSIVRLDRASLSR